MRLTTVEHVRDMIGVESFGDMDRAIGRYLDLATYTLAEILRVRDFARTEQTDYFRVDRTYRKTSPVPVRRNVGQGVWRETGSVSVLLETRLSLRNGFLDSVAKDDLPVVTAPLRDDVDGTSFDDVRDWPVTGQDYVTGFAEQGLLVIQDVDLSGRYVKVGPYSSGFYEDSDGVAEGAPEWLRQLAAVETVLMLNANPVIRRDDQPEGFEAAHRAIKQQLVDRHTRYTPGAHKPVQV